MTLRKSQLRPRAVAQVPEQLSGACFDLLNDHLRRLRGLKGHPLRVLHYDQLLATHLIGFFDPLVRSLRTMDARSVTDQQMKKATDELRAARSTISDAMNQMPADALLPLLRQLLARLPDNCSDPNLADLVTLKKRILAIDGSYFRIPCDVLWGLAHRRSDGKTTRQVRLDLHLDVLRFLPVKAKVDGQADASESASFAATVESGVVYLADRNFIDFDFLHAVIDHGSDFVVRLKKAGAGPNLIVLEDRAVDDAADAAGVISDQIVQLPGSQGAPGFGEKKFRVVTVFDPVKKEPVRLLTTLLDVPAQLIGKLYRYRWSIELFFRWLKCVVNVRHLYAESGNGITMQFYIVIIATLITYLHTGARPSIYTAVLMSSAARGTLALETVPEVLERIARERELARLRREKKKQI